MTLFLQLHELIMRLPPFYIRVGPAEIITSAGLLGWGYFEISTWRRHR